ncbi:hypothetical protein D3C76_1653690 [compost metagenome]
MNRFANITRNAGIKIPPAGIDVSLAPALQTLGILRTVAVPIQQDEQSPGFGRNEDALAPLVLKDLFRGLANRILYDFLIS